MVIIKKHKFSFSRGFFFFQKKKAQLDQPFIYIFVAFVFVLVLIFGVTKIKDMNELKEKSAYIKFKTDFQDAVSKTYIKNEGTLLTFSRDSNNNPLSLPSEIKEVCFKERIGETMVILNSYNYNDFKVNNLKPSASELCIQPINNQLSFRLENKIINKEVKVEISEA